MPARFKARRIADGTGAIRAPVPRIRISTSPRRATASKEASVSEAIDPTSHSRVLSDRNHPAPEHGATDAEAAGAISLDELAPGRGLDLPELDRQEAPSAAVSPLPS